MASSGCSARLRFVTYDVGRGGLVKERPSFLVDTTHWVERHENSGATV